ncbi:MAG: ATP-binding cassette domain-containing protein, partial [Sphingomicrobium sp.]
TRAMKGKTPAAVRAQLGRFGFSGDKAMTIVGKLSGGERARLALALITRDAPHLLILDEPTNHLDVDAREALVQALNGYDGAVILISHDRHMVELTADRLVLVDDGKAIDYPGSIDDYIDFVLGRNQPKAAGTKLKAKKLTGKAKDDAKALRQAAADAEAASAKLAAECEALDRELAAAGCVNAITDLSRRRADIAQRLAAAEAHWLEVSERLELLAA